VVSRTPLFFYMPSGGWLVNTDAPISNADCVDGSGAFCVLTILVLVLLRTQLSRSSFLDI
jgi:hypothetical protein